VRIAAINGATFVDLCNDAGEIVQITAGAWKIISSQELPESVAFKRNPTMRPLPKPVRGGSIAELRSFINVEPDGEMISVNDSNFVLVVMWIIACFRDGPYPVLSVNGEAGSSKTTTCNLIRQLVDPSVPLSQSLPKAEHDLVVTAKSSLVLSFDNVSFISEPMSDGLCRISTGSGLRTRELYTNDEESVFSARRPMILNGINNAVKRSDLLDRSLVLPLARINIRRLESELLEAFCKAHPRIFGALLDIVAHGLKNLSKVKSDSNTPRMASFDTFARACETAVWKAGTFRKAYKENRLAAKERLLSADAVALTLKQFIESDEMTFEGEWAGTATELYEVLDPINENVKAPWWPADPDRLSQRLRRIAPELREVWGIDAQFVRKGKDGTRGIQIQWEAGAGGH
jgi:hypothetical protein